MKEVVKVLANTFLADVSLYNYRIGGDLQVYTYLFTVMYI